MSNQLIGGAQGTVPGPTVRKCSAEHLRAQDDLSTDCSVLTLPLTARERLALNTTPASAMAHEYYLRANQLAAASGRRRRVQHEPARPHLRCVDPIRSMRRRGHAWDEFTASSGKSRINAQPACAEEAFWKALRSTPDGAEVQFLYFRRPIWAVTDAMERLLKHMHIATTPIYWRDWCRLAVTAVC